MAKIAISLKIDVSKIDKNRLFNGAKGTYLDATVFIDIDQKDQYENNGMITQSVSKEEKAQNIRGNILGNCKVFWNEAGSQGQQQPMQQAPVQQAQSYGQKPPVPNNPANGQPQQKAPQYNDPSMDFDDDIPFAPIGLQYPHLLLSM
jgi:single-stranded DNA-binding protein